MDGLSILSLILLDRQTKAVRLTERVSWTWRILLRFRHVVTSVMIALACFCFCLFGLRIGLNNGSDNGLSMGLDYGLRIGLSYWLLLGLYQGITQEHLKDQDRPYFNEGIHRSLFNRNLLGSAWSSNYSWNKFLDLSYRQSTKLHVIHSNVPCERRGELHVGLRIG